MRRNSSHRARCVGLKLWVLVATSLLWSTSASSLPATYLEAGLLYTQFSTPYDGTMQLDGSITFPMPLSANLTMQDFTSGFVASGGSYSFFDGVVTYDLSNSSPMDLLFATDANGNIVGWQVEIFSNAGPILLSQNIPSVSGSGFDKVLSSSAQQLALSNGAAIWDVVPEPSVLTLSALGLSVLIATRRRRS